MSSYTCVIADDSNLFRTIIRDLCNELSLFVMKEYERGDRFLTDLEHKNIEEPDLMFLDINMPGRSGKDLIEDILEVCPEAVIIMISTVSDSRIVTECISLGASNYISKESNKELMKDVILSTMRINGMT